MTTVLLDCGCEAVVAHLRGDRLVTCRHQFHHNVTARDGIVYTAKRIPYGKGAA